jgi:negative regulator of sigma E activity
MNYREWLLYRAQKCQTEASEPEVLRYTTWQNYQLVRDWIRRSDAAQMVAFTRNEQLAESRPS